MNKNVKSGWTTACIVTCLFIFGIAGSAFADSAEVLPKGVSSVGIEYRYYDTIEDRFDPDGNKEPLGEDFNGTLDSTVFPALQGLEVPPPFGFGLPPGSASIGDSVVKFEYDINIINFTFAHGITDKLTIGVLVPYLWLKNNVSARLDATNATVGKNPLFGTPADPFGSPVIPVALGGVPLTTEDAQDLIGGGLDVNGDGAIDIPGFRYERFETWDDNGIGDIEAGLKYQYLKTEKWRLAVSGGVRFPTGEVDDPDSLVDISFGDGAWALLFRSHNDYIGFEKLGLNVTLKYDLILPDHETLRVPEDINQPLTINKERVDRDYGDVIGIETSASYQFIDTFGAALLYKYSRAFKASVEGPRDLPFGSLEQETEAEEHVINASVTYSTVPLYMDKKFSVPLTVSLSYRNRFAGSNNVFNSQYVGLGLQVFF